MKIIIKSTQMNLTPALKEYTEKKFGSLKRFIKKTDDSEVIEVFVEIGRATKHHKSGNVFYAEATMRLNKKILRSEFTGPDLISAIDVIKDTLKQSIQRIQKSVIKKNRKPRK